MVEKVLLSFDIGVTNMAYCCIDYDTKRILKWGCFSIKAKTLEAQTRKLIEHLDNLDFFSSLAEPITASLTPPLTVVIEKQPRINARMRVLEGCLLMYFCLANGKGADKVVTYSPHYKLKLYEPINDEPPLNFKLSLKSHYGRKKLGIEHCRRFLKRYEGVNDAAIGTEGSAEGSESVVEGSVSPWITYFESCSKKDDLADSYLQGLSYLNKHNGKH